MVFQSFVDWPDVTIKILNRDEDVDSIQSTADALTLLKKKYQINTNFLRQSLKMLRKNY